MQELPKLMAIDMHLHTPFSITLLSFAKHVELLLKLVPTLMGLTPSKYNTPLDANKLVSSSQLFVSGLYFVNIWHIEQLS